MAFLAEMERTLDDEFNVSVTENGALGYRTTQSALLDLNFQVASLRSQSEEEIVNAFIKAFYEDKRLAIKWLFFLRDVRGGLGERRSFRVIMNHLASTQPELSKKILHIIPYYGRFDDLLQIVSDSECSDEVSNEVVDAVRKQLDLDIQCMNDHEESSLLAKWLPSANSKSKDTCSKGKMWAKLLYPNIKNSSHREKTYRKQLSALRNYLDVVEVKMSSNNWDKIHYDHVPSKSNLIYKEAFMRHDMERRQAYLDAVNNGEAKVNSDVLYPHDIVLKYSSDNPWRITVKPQDELLEVLWNNLPNTIEDNTQNVLVVRDGSGSMLMSVANNSRTSALHIATALAIYFSERIKGQFKDNFITFSSNPKLINLSNLDSLHDKLEKTYAEDECSNTDIEAVFNLVLTTAVKNKISQEEMPSTILILSDMEFNGSRMRFNEKLFDVISKRYENNGYKLPRLVFWNLGSRTGTIPVRTNELGVALISGFSTNLAKMVMSNEIDPYKILLETLNSPRYDLVDKVLDN